jgi:hypothetical protein
MKTLNILIVVNNIHNDSIPSESNQPHATLTDNLTIMDHIIKIWIKTEDSEGIVSSDDFVTKFCWIDKNAYNVSIYKTPVCGVKLHGKIFLNHVPKKNLDSDIYNCVLNTNNKLKPKRNISIFSININDENNVMQTLEKIQTYVIDWSKLQAKLKIEDEYVFHTSATYESIDQKLHPLIPPQSKTKNSTINRYGRETTKCMCQIL